MPTGVVSQRSNGEELSTPRAVPRGTGAKDYVGIAILILVVAIVGYLTILPIFYLLWGTFFDSDGFTLGAIQRALEGDLVSELLWNSTVFAVGATIVSVCSGTFLAFLTQRTDIPGKRALFVLAIVPLIIPGILYTVSWVFLASPRIGLLSTVLRDIGLPPVNVFSMTGMVLVQGFDGAALAFLLMVAVFRSMDPSLEESAISSGASIVQLVRRISLPLVVPGVIACSLLMLVRNYESFETPAILGPSAGVWVLTSRIYDVLRIYPADYGQAGAYSLTLLVLISILSLWYFRYLSRGKRFEVIGGKGFRPRPLPLRTWRVPMTLFAWAYLILTVVLPVVMLVYMSVQSYLAPVSLDSLRQASFATYETVLASGAVRRSFANSIFLGVATATALMTLTAVASWIVLRSNVRGRWLLDLLTYAPLVIPGLVLGVGLLFIYLRLPIGIYGSLWILFIAYATRFIPYAMRYASASMRQISGELEESARTCGANWLQTFRLVVLPLLIPGFFAGWLYVFMISMRELSSSILLYSPGNEVLAVTIWRLYEDGGLNQLAAVGVLMVLVLIVVSLVARRVFARFGVSEYAA